MVSTYSLISKSFSPFTNFLGIAPSPPTKIGVSVTFMFHVFLWFSSKVQISISLFVSFIFTLWSGRMSKFTLRLVLFFFGWLSLGLVVWPILGDPFVSQNFRDVYVSSSRTSSGLCIHYLFEGSNFNFFTQLPVDYLPHPVVYGLIFFCVNLLWLLVLYLSPHNLHFLFCCVLSIFALT